MQMTRMSCGNGKSRTCIIEVLFIWSSVYFTCTECNMITTQDTTLLTNFVKRFIQPYVQSLQFPANTPSERSLDESPIQKAIHEVIEHLKPFLQDEDIEGDDKVSTDGTGETTIIEILPRYPNNIFRTGEPQKASTDLQTSINKYEKIKSDIKAALEKESVSLKTKKMVIRTLDDLIAQVIGNQCTWKNSDYYQSLTFRNGKNEKHNITLEEWDGLKKQYLNFLERKQMNNSMVLFNDFHNFFSKVINDTDTLSKQYKVKCQLIQSDDDDKKTVLKEGGRAQNDCVDFKLCSEELKEFLVDFYKSLNDTTTGVFKNYAAMYAKDVFTDADDGIEIDSVPSVLENMSNAVDRRVSKVFLQELSKFKLDNKKNKEANIKLLREFVRGTCKRVQKHLKKHLESDLVTLKARLLLTVMQDINMNLGVDLGNLEADIKGRICTVLVTCNSRVSANRRSLHKRQSINPNSLYVKVKIRLNDTLKDTIEKTHKKLFSLRKNMPEISDLKYKYRRNLKYLNVTRTTVGLDSTTQNITSNPSDLNDILKNIVLEKF